MARLTTSKGQALALLLAALQQITHATRATESFLEYALMHALTASSWRLSRENGIAAPRGDTMSRRRIWPGSIGNEYGAANVLQFGNSNTKVVRCLAPCGK
nr:hypothetical protein [Xanthomonas albilineans]